MNELDKQVSQILIEIVTRHSERIDWLGIDYYGPKLIAIIREEIALDIEAKNLGGCGRSHCGVDFREFNKIFAAIARGEVKE